MSLILGIESSCDETAASVVCGREILSNVIASQVETHALYGGVVPEIASRAHVESVVPVVKKALSDAGVSAEELDAVGVTYGPGLVGALLCGVSYAKGFAYEKGLPLIPVHHIEGHICANYLADPTLEPPFVALVVSGGHSHLVEVTGYGHHRILGKTRDDAAGEAYDKAARVLGLPYPGGPSIDKLAAHGDPDAMPLPKAKTEGLNYSFSGLKTALLQAVARAEKEHITLKPEDIAASFQKAVVTQLLHKAELALTLPDLLQSKPNAFVLAGGVACNSGLRAGASAMCKRLGIRFGMPPPVLCTDNAAMIAFAASYRYERGERAGLELNAVPSMVLPE